MNIRTRLAFLFASLVATLLLAFALGIYYFSARFRENEFYERLREKAITTARLLYEAGQQITPQTLQLIDEQDSTLLFSEHVTVFNHNRQLIYDSQQQNQVLDENLLKELQKHSGGEIRRQEREVEILYKLYQEPGEMLIVRVAAIDNYGLSKMAFLTGVLSFSWFIGVGAIIGFGWFFAGKALSPIKDVVQQVEEIDMATLDTSRVKAGNDKDEISQLAHTFNRMLERLQQSFIVQRSFVANASHELRTPLTIMSGQIEVALLQNRQPEEYRNTLKSLLEDVNEMTDLANDLLDLAQASSDISILPFKMTRIDELLLQTESEFLKKHKDYDVIVDFPEAPDNETLFELSVNERLLKKAFLNLMENACKFSSDKKVYIHIFFKSDNIRLEFTDKGIGIAKKDIPYIFEPFFRSENARNFSSGHGIGLHLTQKIIRLHQGEITVSSALNKGTTFMIDLPHL